MVRAGNVSYSLVSPGSLGRSLIKMRPRRKEEGQTRKRKAGKEVGHSVCSHAPAPPWPLKLEDDRWGQR
jgi:hypothetical protein